jgi:hypothetical protein
MSWVRIDDRWWSDPQVLALSPDARDLFIRLLAYCGTHDNDGVLSASELGVAAAGQPGAKRRRTLVAELVNAGFLTDSGYGYRVSDPFRYLRSRSDVERDREVRKAGGRARAEQAQKHGRNKGKFVPSQQPDEQSDQQPAGDGSQQPAGDTTSTYPGPARPGPSQKVPIKKKASSSGEGADFWAKCGPEWGSFREAMVARGFALPPTPKQREMLRPIVRDFPEAAGRWVKYAPEGLKSNQVIAFVLKRHKDEVEVRLRAADESEADADATKTRARREAPTALRDIVQQFAGTTGELG